MTSNILVCFLHKYFFVCAVPGIPQTLVCARSSGLSDLIFLWTPPTAQRNEIVGYRVDVKRLAHRDGTREVIQSDVVTLTTPKTEANITQGLGTNRDTPGLPTHSMHFYSVSSCWSPLQHHC